MTHALLADWKKDLRLAALITGLLWVLLHLGGCDAAGQEQPPAAVPYRMELPPEQRAWYRNPDGSCVQCSNGMIGLHMADDSEGKRGCRSFAWLLWDHPEYGNKVRGGSWPSRVEQYAKARGVAIYNVTGDLTYDWMRWAAVTGRFAAIGFCTAHFQTLYGWEPQTNTWFVCDNNSPRQVDQYNWQHFVRQHRASGEWAVILDYCPPPMVPVYVEWWR